MNYFNNPTDPHNDLGFIPPFYIEQNGKFNIDHGLRNILDKSGLSRTIDPAAVIQIISTNYCFADRTLIQGLHRTPWLAYPDKEEQNWIFDLPEKQNHQIFSYPEISKKLYDLLSQEIIRNVQSHSRIGVLLTGGMDSRIIAGIVHNLLKTRDIDANVVGITWGKPGSRDVVYAERICKILGWKWIRVDLSTEDLKNNIELTAELGCEFPPQHLHALPKIRDMEDIDCVIVATYGDSIGRGVFSGKHISKLTHLKSSIKNPYALVKRHIYLESQKYIDNDLDQYHGIKTDLELQQYIHYLRRMLNPAFFVIKDKMAVYHAFGSKKTYEYIWSLDPAVRTNEIYKVLLSLMNPELSKIPWAKTGYLFQSSSGKPDRLSPGYHDYYHWIHKDIFPFIRDWILSGNLQKLGIFNTRNIESLLERFRKTEDLKEPRLCQIISWLSSLSIFCEEYNISGIESYPSPLDHLNSRLKFGYDIIQQSTKSRIRKTLH